MLDAPYIDGHGPLLLTRPSSVGELREVVRRTTAAQEALYPVGGATMLEWGLPPTKPGIVVDLRELKSVIDYPARDMTITVQAGITIKELRDVLKREGQQLPVDVPLPERATLGGAIATNASGPRRFGYGTLRDYVIGISVMNDRGEEIKGGGRVVKNVAGYDLMKLYTGSFGTLGIITQVTLKVKPLAESVVVLACQCPNDAIAHVINEVLPRTVTRPTIISIANSEAGSRLTLNSTTSTLLIGFEEKAETVRWQVSQLNKELPEQVTKIASEFQGELAMGALHRWSDFPLAPPTTTTFKVNLLPSKTGEFFKFADSLSPKLALLAHAGNGIVFGHLPRESTVEQAKEVLDRLRVVAVAGGGNLVVTRCPTAWKSVIPIWGQPTPDRVLMRAVKEKLDPGNVYNPGRFVDGI